MTPGPPPHPSRDEADAVRQPMGELFGGRYVIGGLLGVGGSAAVYEAEDAQASPAEDDRVAVKVLHPQLCARVETREAFLREARLAQGLRHPNVVAVRGSGVYDAGGVTLAWIALELVTGPTLAEWVGKAGPAPPAVAVGVMDGVLAGLAAAHAHGLVHRDVSPRNVLLAGSSAVLPRGRASPGRAKLVDFGLADAAGRTTVGGDVLLTHDGGGDTVVGSAQYMSPEQARGRPVSASGDLYQAGALLYFLLTGQPPYPRGTADQVLQAHLSAPPPVPSVVVPAAHPLDRVVTTAMAKDPSRRFRDADEFRHALHHALEAATGTPRTRVLPLGTGAPTEAVASIPGPGHQPSAAAPVVSDVSPAVPPAAATSSPLSYLGPPVEPRSAAEPLASEWGDDRSSGGLVAAGVVVVTGLAVWAVVAAFASPAPSVLPTAPAPRTASLSPAAAPSPSASRTSAPSPSQTPTVRTVAVPSLAGSLAEAEAALRRAGLTLGAVSRVQSASAEGQVLGQSPDAGEPAAPGSTVDVVVASGFNAVPSVAGLTLAAATAVVESAGLTAVPDSPDAAAARTVTGSLPAAGVVVRLGTRVALLVAPEATTPSPDATSGGSPPSSAPPPSGP
ncbi:serine/threonine protein kinase [Propionicicella superfundia]|uniref:serine/threonine protein kinase n=1 Tax=Propionicicella superfundia TaxID=348582 RepID=UPI000425D779|nr:protein kinase [Propionicicella superfundia]